METGQAPRFQIPSGSQSVLVSVILLTLGASDRENDPPAARPGQVDRAQGPGLGDVHPEVEAIAGAMTPVPGGVGPMTVTMLLNNTVVAAERVAARRA